jgi:hypothetical protein
MLFYARFRGADLPRAVGFDGENGVRRSDGEAGVLAYGPYLNLSPGDYTAALYIRREASSDMGELEFDVCCDHGSRNLGTRRIPADEVLVSIAGLHKVDFSLDGPVRAWEARLRVPEGFIGEIRELILYRREPSNWGA